MLLSDSDQEDDDEKLEVTERKILRKFLGPIKVTTEPVSYTHLDVYKRQT